MKIISTNVGTSTPIQWRGRTEQTGIFKYPVDEGIFLDETDVTNDTVIDRKHHGGEYKACYLFAAEEYEYWRGLYPDHKWNWGMFGENLTVEGLDETGLTIGSIYQVGGAQIQITEPRQPCYKLGIRFNDQNIIKKFVDHGRTGTYVRIIVAGLVKKGDSIELLSPGENPLTVQQYHLLVTRKEKDPQLVKLAVQNDSIRPKKRKDLEKYL